MSFLRKNIERFGLFDLDESLTPRNVIFDGCQELAVDYRTANRVLYIAFDIFGVQTLEEIIVSLNEKSALYIHYQNPADLVELLTTYDLEIDPQHIMFTYGDFNDVEVFKTIHDRMSGILYSYSNISPIIKKSNEIGEIRLAKKFIEALADLRDRYTFEIGNDIDDTLYGVRNRYINLPEYIKNPGLIALKRKMDGKYKGIPAIVVASGPSLDKNIHHLKEYQDKALILSCDGSLSTLEKHGIKADVVGSVERSIKTYQAFYEDRVIDKEIVFVGPAIVRPEIIETIDNRFVSFFKKRDFFSQWIDKMTFGEKGNVFCGSSVAHLLSQYAMDFGCEPIILVGQDLAYTNEGISHASSAEFTEHVSVDTVEIWLDDVHGGKVPSSFIWKSFLNIYEKMIRECDVKFIDATEGGALIRGTEIAIFKDVLEAYCQNEKPNMRKDLDSLIVTDDEQKAALAKVLDDTLSVIKRYDEFIELVQKAAEKNEKAIDIASAGIETQEQLDSIFDIIEHVDEDIVKNITTDGFYMMLFQYSIREAAKMINSLESSEFTVENIKFNLMLHKELLSVFEFNVNRMIRVLVEGLNNMNHAFVENSLTFDYDKYCETYADWYNDPDYDIILN